MNIVLYWQNQARKYGERPAYRRKVNGEWVRRSWKEYGEVVKQFAIGFRGAKISSDAGVLMAREIDERFNITAPLGDRLHDPRRASHLRHTYLDLIRQRAYQMAAGYEDCNDANHLRIDPALRLALGKDEEYAASQLMLFRLENEILGNDKGMAALDETLQRSTDALLRKKSKGRLIVDMDSTEDPAHGKQEGVAYNGHFGKSCYHPLFCFTSEGDCTHRQTYRRYP